MVDVIVGLQLGDESKGKVTDLLSENYDVVARVQGGGNAGHTVVVGDKTLKFHHIPSGVVRNKKCLLGAGMVIDPKVLMDEINYLQDNGFDTSNIFIDGSAHISLPILYPFLDGRQENDREVSIGTTKKGIGPAYSNKHARFGLRFWDLVNNLNSSQGIENFGGYILPLLYSRNHVDPAENAAMMWQDMDVILNSYSFIKNMIVDGRLFIKEHNDSRILIEGAQGCWLDVDYGQYPFVTSSCTTATGACLGTGLSVRNINHIYGVAKAYTTYVGNGAYPAEATKEDGDYLREKGHEYGTTTGRPRRCGYLDIPMLKNANQINSCTEVFLAKVDVLTGLKKIKIVVAYDLDGKTIDYVPSNSADYARCKPIYEELDGWDELPTENVKYVNDFPQNTIAYIRKIEDLADCCINNVSYGPERNQIVSGYAKWS